jgi:hypothetical protein
MGKHEIAGLVDGAAFVFASMSARARRTAANWRLVAARRFASGRDLVSPRQRWSSLSIWPWPT